MDRLQKSFLVTLSLLALLTDPGSGFSITEGPSNVTALAGTEARFNCTVTEGWQILIWLFEGQPVLSVTYPGKAIITDKSYSQQGYNKSTEFTSELTIHNVQLNNSGRIECSLQTVSGNQYAFLSVQVNGSLDIKDHNLTVRMNQTIEIVCEAVGWDPAPHITWMVNNISVDNSYYITNQSQGSNSLYNEDSILTLTPVINSTVICLAAILALTKPQSATMTLVVYPPPKSGTNEDDGRIRTIILAVVLSIVGFLLLILIILLLVCCCKKKESNYQKEMRKVSKQNLETVSDSGNENYGYSPEEQKHTKQMSRAPLPPPPADSGFRGPEQDLAVGSASEISTYLSSSSQSLPSISPVPPLYHFNEHSQKHTVQQSRRISQRQSRVISSKIQKPTVHWPQKRKLKPQTKQSNGQHYYTRKVYFQRWQSSGHSTYTKKLTYHPKQSETQDPQRHTQHLRRKYKYPKIQQKKGQHSKSWAQPQHQKAQASERKQLHPSSKTKAPRVQFLL
ncbi:immunoglobulin superfamily member 5 isoform X2 [Eublepharis macularius]|uniref:immunoglobulin superfamily member 5 isoform X2 n=1 Tax=Eublepharis macularius TaxID=481883 RepID=UPI002410A66B|nr:immunoglobulin superfamily member 5 isoform X2 [Eublepharis macularius]